MVAKRIAGGRQKVGCHSGNVWRLNALGGAVLTARNSLELGSGGLQSWLGRSAMNQTLINISTRKFAHSVRAA